MDGRGRKKPGKPRLAAFFIALAVLVFLSVLGFAGYFAYLLASLPKVDRLTDYKPPIVTQVFGDNGTLVGEFYLERRTVCSN